MVPIPKRGRFNVTGVRCRCFNAGDPSSAGALPRLSPRNVTQLRGEGPQTPAFPGHAMGGSSMPLAAVGPVFNESPLVDLPTAGGGSRARSLPRQPRTRYALRCSSVPCAPPAAVHAAYRRIQSRCPAMPLVLSTAPSTLCRPPLPTSP